MIWRRPCGEKNRGLDQERSSEKQRMKKISIVVPVYNEEENIEQFYKEICRVMDTQDYDFELIFIDDGSTDDTRVFIAALEDRDCRVQGIVLARNFGHQAALTCGLDQADGDAVITMDGDLQHPPQLVPLLLQQWETGADVVQTIRQTTEGVSWLKKFTSNFYYKVLNRLSKVPVQPGGSDFRLMDRRVVLAFRRYREQARFIRGLIGAMGYHQTTLTFIAPQRFAGKSKFSLHKMIHFALDGIMAYSTSPLRLGLYGGVVCGFISLLLMLHVLFIKFFTGDAVPGWATITVSLLFFCGVQLSILGIIGEYIGRVFEEVKRRPLYLIERGKPGTEEAHQP